MTTRTTTQQQSIHDILHEALQKIREEQGVAVYRVSADWLDTFDRPDCAVTQINIEARAAK